MSKAARVARTSADLVGEQAEGLRAIFPDAFSEGRVDWDRLRATLGEVVDDRPERYSFAWAGKRDAIRPLQIPSRAALIPCPEESVNWESCAHHKCHPGASGRFPACLTGYPIGFPGRRIAA